MLTEELHTTRFPPCMQEILDLVRAPNPRKGSSQRGIGSLVNFAGGPKR